MVRKVIWVSVFLFLCSYANAQLIINEVCSSNDFIFTDEFNDTPDWIELYNAGNQVEELSQYFITEDIDIPTDWQLPNYQLQPGEFFLILASGRGLQNNRVHTSFKVKKDGEAIYLFRNDRTLIDGTLLPKNETDWSYGRIEEGSEWGFFSIPSPMRPNSESVRILQTAKPVFSISEQFQQQAFTIEISSSTSNSKIFFTLDGSLPTENSFEYSAPFEISKTTSVRAFAMTSNEVPSEIETTTYFVGENSTLPVVSLSVDSLLLFDEVSGMLSFGPDAESSFPFWGANFWKNIELPVHFEYFSKEGEKLIEFGTACKVHGGRSSRTKPQRSLRFTAKPAFGIDKFEYPFFSDKPNVNSFETIVLRNSSGDFCKTHFRDGFLSQYMIDEGLNLDVMSYQPANIYINGNYWGVMNLREKSDETFVVANYGIELDKLDVLEEDTLVIWGDRTIFTEDVSFVRNSDLTKKDVFENVSKRFDINSFADYIISETYLNNTDWGHNNLKLWREKRTEGKWRYLFFDLDAAMEGFPWTRASTEVFIQKMNEYADDENAHIFVFKQLLKNRDFKNYFINRYCDLLNTSFRPEIFSEALANHANFMEPAMKKHFTKWTCPECFSYERWDTVFVPRIIQYSIDKAPLSRQELQTYFSLENEVLLNLEVFPEGAGSIQINTVSPKELPWNGYYFKGVPVELSITSNPGFVFEKWEALNHELNTLNPNLTFDFSEDDEIVAIFKSNEIDDLQSAFVYPNPTNDLATINFVLTEKSFVEFEIFSADGKLIQQFPSQLFNVGKRRFSFDVSQLRAGHYFLRINSENKFETVEFQK